MRDDTSLILDVLSFKSPWGDDGPNEMETLAIAAHDPGNKFKHVVVNVRGMNGNTLVILGNVKAALQRAGASYEEIAIFLGDAMSQDYEHALATVVKWVTVTDKTPEPKDDAWSAMVRCVTSREED